MNVLTPKKNKPIQQYKIKKRKIENHFMRQAVTLK